MAIKEAKTKEEIESCFEVVNVLRPHITTKEELSSKVLAINKDGYHLMYIQDEENGPGTSFCGYRIQNFLSSGKTLYIDDLSTLSTSRGRGHGGAQMKNCIDVARRENCNQLTLDSGPLRYDAHRLYHNSGLQLNCHHLTRKCTGVPPPPIDCGMEIKEAKSKEEIEACFEVLKELHPHIKTKEEFCLQVLQLRNTEGYHLMHIQEKENGPVISAIAYRLLNFLWSGKMFFIDDLGTLSSERRKGYGKALIQWCIELADKEQCNLMSLYTPFDKYDSHRLFLNCGFHLEFHHFTMQL